jgi:hypothetical protein
MVNGALGADLPVDGLVSSDLRAALRDFQRRQGLPVSGFVGPDTIDALKQMSGLEPSGELADEEFEISDKMVRRLDENLKNTSMNLKKTELANVPEVPGLYRITWLPSDVNPPDVKPLARARGNYYGSAYPNLRRRLQQHITEVGQLGFSSSRHKFAFAQMPGRNEADVRSAEEKIITLHFGEAGIRNKRRGELELL